MVLRTLPVAALLLLISLATADGPKDNTAENVRPVPPKGAPVPDADKAELEAGLKTLGTAIDELKKLNKSDVTELLPDVEIYHKAVRYALTYDEMFIDKGRNDIAVAKAHLKTGLERASELKAGKPSWPAKTGLVVRGYRSKIDGSVQPYGLVVPKSYNPQGDVTYRLDFWWHGRGEVLTELNFIDQRQKSLGEFTPLGAFVLHPYGRYCNANKFAGEVDTFECLEHAKKHYRIDELRLVARGFSMGGAACWQFATHHPGLWAAAAPGAGFAETPEFLNNFQNETLKPTWYEKKLWHLYNATDYATNLYNVPTVAYSGEVDKQKQAADVMARELLKDDLELSHVIGVKAGHQYTPAAKKEINRRIDAIVDGGRDTFPYEIRLNTYTLRYNQNNWVRIDGLGKHWEKAHVTATLQADTIEITTENVKALTIDIPSGKILPGTLTTPFVVSIDADDITVTKRPTDRSLKLSFEKKGEAWELAGKPDTKLKKKPGLQGPIDDAFLDRFVFVKPTGKPMNEKIGAWTTAEMARAVKEWRKVFRGDAIVKDDTAITDDDIATSNLILWGDPKSNAVLAKVVDKLPLKEFGDTKTTILVYPNPLNPEKYVVLNSGFTFREYDALNNARQVPKLPDYAVVDVTTPPNSRTPGKVVRAGFFNEKWELQSNDGQNDER